MADEYYCWKCQKKHPKEKIYFNERAPHFNFCRECVNSDIQNDIIKAIPYLHNYRIPVYPEIWEFYRQFIKEKYGENKKSIFGYYLERMKMCTWWGCDFLNFYDKYNEYPEVRKAWEEYILNCIKNNKQEIENDRSKT